MISLKLTDIPFALLEVKDTSKHAKPHHPYTYDIDCDENGILIRILENGGIVDMIKIQAKMKDGKHFLGMETTFPISQFGENPIIPVEHLNRIINEEY